MIVVFDPFSKHMVIMDDKPSIVKHFGRMLGDLLDGDLLLELAGYTRTQDWTVISDANYIAEVETL